MPIKRRCSDLYKYGCTAEHETETVEEMQKFFKLNKLINGHYFRTVCRKCEAKKRMELYYAGYKSYPWSKRKTDRNDYSDAYGVISLQDVSYDAY